MEAMWSIPNPYAAEKINSGSISFDKKLYFQDIECSMAHTAMLGGLGFIEPEMSDRVIESLGAILDGLDMGTIPFNDSANSVRDFLDKLLDERVEGASALINSFRHENERASGALRLYLRDEWMDMRPLLAGIISALSRCAREKAALSIAQPLLAASMMLARDIERINSLCERMNRSPLGAYSPDGPLSGTDRMMMCSSLGFSSTLQNSMDALTDTDFCTETVSDLAIIGAHLQRLVSTLVSFDIQIPEISPMRRLLAAPQSFLALTMNASSNLAFDELGDMSESACALINSCESIKTALKMLREVLPALSATESEENHRASLSSTERQLDFIEAFLAKQNDGSGRY